jgi:peptidoglycan/xylan/chitin deacetylase (PgdA/CDA1 family)
MSIAFHKTPIILKKIFPGLTWQREPTAEKKIYLTFDDGPVPDLTEYVIDLLAQYNARATFFCVGDNIRKYPEILTKVDRGGHRIGNHTFHHVKGWKMSHQAYLDDIDLCEKIIRENASDQPFNLFRPPYGQIKPGQIGPVAKKYEIIMWSVLAYDFEKRLNTRNAINKCIQYSKNGSIVVFHDNYKAEKNLKTILPAYLQHFSNEGFTFAPL